MAARRRDQRPLDGGARDREVLDGPLRLGLPFGCFGNTNLAHGVVARCGTRVSLMWGRYSTDGGPVEPLLLPLLRDVAHVSRVNCTVRAC